MSTGLVLNEAMIAVIGRRIRELREEQGLSQADLASQVHVPLQYVQQVESGKHVDAKVPIFRMAVALGTTVDKLLQ